MINCKKIRFFIIFSDTLLRILLISVMAIHANTVLHLAQVPHSSERGLIPPLFLIYLYFPLKIFLHPPFLTKVSTRSIKLYILERPLGKCLQVHKEGSNPSFLVFPLIKSCYTSLFQIKHGLFSILDATNELV